MTDTTQLVIVTVMAALAVFQLVRLRRRPVASKDGPAAGCAGCDSCGDTAEPPAH